MEELSRINERPSRVLVGSLAIDRDHEQVDRVFAGMQGLSRMCEWDLLVVSREQDTMVSEKWRRHGANVVTIPDYPINKRHNLWKIAEKRNLVREHGRDHGYDAVLFVDSDVVMTEGVIADLFDCAEYADVVVAPYRIRWSDEYTVGLMVDGRFTLVDARELMKHTRYPRILGGSLGCTLIHSKVFDVPIVPVQLGNVDGVAGEDIGFFHQIYTTRPELIVRTTSWPFVPEHIL